MSVPSGSLVTPGSVRTIRALRLEDDATPDAHADPVHLPARQIATRFSVRVDDRVLFVRAHDVDLIEADGNYVRLHVQKQAYRLRATIRLLVSRLDPLQFVRIHKSTIVNLDRIREVQAWFGGDYVAILLDGRQLRVSRTYARDLLRPIR